MTTTKTAIRQSAGWNLEGRLLLISEATDGDVEWIEDAIRLQRPGRGWWWQTGYVYLYERAHTDTDRLRVVTTDDPDLGRLSVAPSWTVAPVAGEAYEAWSKYDPVYEVEPAIQKAINQLHLPSLFEFPGLGSNLVGYDLSDAAWLAANGFTAFNWLVQPDQVVGVYERTGTAVGEYQYSQVPGAQVRFNGTTPSLYLPYGFDPSQTLQLRIWRTLGDVATVATMDFGDLLGLSSSPRMLDYAGLWVAEKILSSAWQYRMGAMSAAERQAQLMEIRYQLARMVEDLRPRTARPLFASVDQGRYF